MFTIQIVIESLETALASLIETKNFSEISISELVKKAGIARSTFYRNYECKEDIIRFSIRRTLNEFSMQ
ncbi:MAG: TetR/AcrR family transcriptional regulator [Lachnospiraceae bacterium]|nr:TetR/AcrR family transcriptional regulator [Lachnospiraceae bacterium]